MKRLLLAACCIALTGCTNLANFNSIHRDVKLDNVGSQLIDAKQRAVLVWPGAGDNGAGMGVCAEPSPDAFSVLAASGELGVSNPAGVGGAGSFASAESGVSPSRRTTTILAQRDAYFRLCEARANGWIDDIDLMVGQRHNQMSLIGMLAIEQLTGAISAPTVALGGTSQAVSASAIQAVASARTAEVKHNADLKKQKEAAETAHTEKKAEVDAHAKVAEPKEDPEKTAHTTKTTKLAGELAAAKKKVDDLTTEIETSDKLLGYYNKALETAAATGSSAASLPAVIVPQPNPEAQKDVAATVQRIVEILDANDMGPTICLRYLRGYGANGEGAAQCKTILTKYADSMQAQVDAMSIETNLQKQLLAVLAAIKNPADPKVYDSQVKPILEVLGALKRSQAAASPTRPRVDGGIDIKSDGKDR